MRKFSCLVAVAMAIGCGDDEVRMEIDAGPGVDMSGLDMETPMVDMGSDPVDMGSDPVDMAGEETPDMGDDTDMGDDVDMFTPDPSCDDGVLNGDETGIDCGGETCENRCGPGVSCDISADCDSMACIAGTCQGATCSDGIQNGTETGRDCGGEDCGGCGLGEGCVDMDDCAMGMCDGGFCVADHCFSGDRDVNETDVDCGGPDCGPCLAGDRCAVDGDCSMGTCETGFCRTAACTNGAMDAGEVGVDCGGECPGCDDGTSCTMDEDCLSDRCDAMVCTSCNDGTQNGTESAVDCGGDDCRPCFGGDSCTVGTDCASGVCTGGICEGATAYLDSDFNADDGGWTSGGTSSSWEYATPATADMTMAYTGTMVWVTNADGDYNSNEDSWVESPSFDLSGASEDPIFEMAIHHILEKSCATCTAWDIAWVELSTDGGSTWEDVGVIDEPNWYNEENSPGQDGFGGDSGGYIVVSRELTGAAGFADVKVRIHLDSDGSTQLQGVAFDDVRIFEDLCTNGVLDPGEADIDCGGGECGVCTDGASCVMDGDCESMRCDGGTCTSCSDGIQNGGEAAIDCGGGMCAFCPGGTPCTDGSICASEMCDGGTCADQPVFLETDFETDESGFTAGGSGSWAYGTPAGPVIDSAASGTNAWVTNLTGDYSSSEDSWIESPALDLSRAVSDPILSFNLFYETESCCDEGWVEVSVDGGTTWDKVLAGPMAMGWYNDTSNDWWDGTNGGWTEVSTVLAGTAGESDVRIRWRLDSDGSVQADGFGIDDVRVGPPAPDLSVEIAPSPELCGAGIVSVTNLGSAPVSFFDLTTVVDGSSSTSRIMRSLEPGQTFNATISATTTLEASVMANGDDEPSNDSASMTIEAGITIEAAMRYLETFESDDGGWVSSGTNSDWEWGEPSGSFIGSADSGMNAWVTDLNGTYNSNQSSQLVSPCFDLSALGADPVLSLSRIFETEPTDDHAYIEYTTDGGISWSKLGTAGSGTNWYNDLLGDFWDGVSGAPDFWSRSSHPLVGAAGQARVRVRFVFTSDASTSEDGFGVDDVIIQP